MMERKEGGTCHNDKPGHWKGKGRGVWCRVIACLSLWLLGHIWQEEGWKNVLLCL